MTTGNVYAYYADPANTDAILRPAGGPRRFAVTFAQGSPVYRQRFVFTADSEADARGQGDAYTRLHDLGAIESVALYRQ